MSFPVDALLGIIELEKDPPRFADFWPQTKAWITDAGGFAAAGLMIWIISVFSRPAAAAIGPNHEWSRRK